MAMLVVQSSALFAFCIIPLLGIAHGAQNSLHVNAHRYANITSNQPMLPSTPSPTSLPACSGSEDLAKWFQYWEEQETWSAGSASWRKNLPSPTGVTKTDTIIDVLETIKTIGKGTTYTECDGIPRFRYDSDNKDLRTTKQRVTVTTTYEWVYTGPYRHPKYSETKPTEPTHCELTEQKCIELWENYDSSPNASKRPPCPPPGFCIMNIEDEVALIYWQLDHPRDICATNAESISSAPSTYPTVTGKPTVITTDAITFRGQDLYYISEKDTWPLMGDYNQALQQELIEEGLLTYPNSSTNETGEREPEYLTKSVLQGSFAFTYPTLYLAHRPVTVKFFSLVTKAGKIPSFTHSTFRATRSAGVFAIPPNKISSMRPIDRNRVMGIEYAQLAAQGKFAPASFQAHHYKGQDYRYERVPLNTADLIDPVPASVYFDARHQDCWGQQSHCQTITDDSYRPPLVVDYEVWLSVVKEHFPCDRVFMVSPADPPIALHPIDGELTVPSRPPAYATPATPGHGVMAEQFTKPTGSTAGMIDRVQTHLDSGPPAIVQDHTQKHSGATQQGRTGGLRSGESKLDASKTRATFATGSGAQLNSSMFVSCWATAAFLLSV